MRALDTNIIARFVVQDDAEQGQIATQVLAEPCFIADSVLLETAWLLASRYGMARRDLADTLIDIVNLPSVTVSNLDAVTWAVMRFAAGADFADMMHIISSTSADCFASFEKTLGKLAGPDSPLPIEQVG